MRNYSGRGRLSYPYVIVVSHQRSGTHLAIDTICNNFEPYAGDYLNLDLLAPRSEPRKSLEELRVSLESAPRVVKCHSHISTNDYFEGNREIVDFVDSLFSTAKLIYVHRDGRDVMTSLYFYKQMQNSCSLGDFLRRPTPLGVDPAHCEVNVVEYWRTHVTGWLARSPALLLSFEDLVRSPRDGVARIADFLEVPARTDLRTIIRRRGQERPRSSGSELRERFYKRYMRYVHGVRVTSTVFRRGEIGDYRNHFSIADLELFDQLAGDVMHRIGYE